MKICLVTTFFGAHSFGGDAVYVERLSDALLRRGHEVHVICSAGAFHCVKRGHTLRAYRASPALCVHVIDTGWRGVATALWSHQTGRVGPFRSGLRNLIRAEAFDVVHLHNVSLLGHAHLFDLIGDTCRPVKLVTAHDYWWVCPQSLLWKNGRHVCDRPACAACLLRAGRPPQLWRDDGLMTRALAQADAVLFPSRSAMEIHAQRGLRHPRIRQLSCLVPPEWFAEGPAERPASRPYFAAAGRLVPEKGLQDLIPLMRELPEYDLRIAGSGPLERTLRQMASGLSNVRLVGQIASHEVAALFRGALAVVVPSLFPETFGYVAAEAMAVGTPVVARRLGALIEMVEETGGGLLFRSTSELREHLRVLSKDRPLREHLGRSGHASAACRWSEEQHVAAYLRLIEELQ